MRCLKSLEKRSAARQPGRQTAKIQLCVALMNRFSALGTAGIVCIARQRPAKGPSLLKPSFGDNAAVALKVQQAKLGLALTCRRRDLHKRHPRKNWYLVHKMTA